MAVEPGGDRRRGVGRALACAVLLVGSPLFVAYVWLCCEEYECAISGPLLDVALGQGRSPGRLLLDGLPRPTLAGFTIFAVWYAAQAALALTLPGRIGYGTITAAGHRPAYRLNGLLAWLVTHVLLGLAVFRWRLFPSTIVADNSGGLMVAANTAGLLVAVFAYWKARRFPSRPADRRWSGHAVSDFFMGVELHPRIGPLDLKLFHVGRVGMMAWTVVNASFAARQFQELGYVTSSMILVYLLQLVYVLDFFAREDWYLRTIDMQHDRFGFYLAWGAWSGSRSCTRSRRPTWPATRFSSRRRRRSASWRSPAPDTPSFCRRTGSATGFAARTAPSGSGAGRRRPSPPATSPPTAPSTTLAS
jgi:7-dehydrocholesterol reductase